MWIPLGFGALGFLIGNLVGLSSTPIVKQVVGLLFAFAGGSVLAFIRKLKAQDRKTAGAAIFALSLACTLGLYIGVLTKTHHLLSPQRTTDTLDPDYLRNAKASRAALINSDRNAHPEDSYQNLYKLALQYEDLLQKGGCK
jgi:hypothetical protein